MHWPSKYSANISKPNKPCCQGYAELLFIYHTKEKNMAWMERQINKLSTCFVCRRSRFYLKPIGPPKHQLSPKQLLSTAGFSHQKGKRTWALSHFGDKLSGYRPFPTDGFYNRHLLLGFLRSKKLTEGIYNIFFTWYEYVILLKIF